jgi:hypothetical protein
MNTVRAIRGLALTGVASLGLIAMTPAFAESDFQTGAGALSATADLDVRVIIPRFISFRVGTTGATEDLVEFTVAAANVGSGTDVARTNAGGAAVPVQLISNVGNVTLASAGSGTGLTSGANVLPWTEIDGTSSDAANLPVPAVGSSVLLTAASGVINRTANWTFTYDNTNTIAAGTYDGTVTYTASAP